MFCSWCFCQNATLPNPRFQWPARMALNKKKRTTIFLGQIILSSNKTSLYIVPLPCLIIQLGDSFTQHEFWNLIAPNRSSFRNQDFLLTFNWLRNEIRTQYIAVLVVETFELVAGCTCCIRCKWLCQGQNPILDSWNRLNHRLSIKKNTPWNSMYLVMIHGQKGWQNVA